MELTLVNNEIEFEKARHIMELRHIECYKVEEDLKHLKRLSELKEKKVEILNDTNRAQHYYLPKKILTSLFS